MKIWKKKFKEALFPINEEFSKYPYAIQKHLGREDLRPNDNEIDLAYKIKYDNFPKSLFKYRSFDDKGYYLDNINNNKLWLSKAVDFNDPFDARVFTQTDRFFEEHKQILEKMKNDSNINPKDVDDYEGIINVMEENRPLMKLKNEINAHIHRIGCLSEVKDSILMWSHYSSNHSGFCIEYATDELKLMDENATSLYPVFYLNIKKDQREDILNGIKLYKLFAVLRKSKEWKYEKEWRFVVSINDEIDHLIMPRIKAIYIGCNVTEKNKEIILKLSLIKKFDTFQAVKKSGETKLIFEKIN